jgi:iron complex transport system substrate-binding protein
MTHPKAPPIRIASLLASATEIVVTLGLEDSLVGISHECDYPPQVLDRPRLSRVRFDPAGLDSGAIDRAVRAAMAEHGSVYALDGDQLAQLRPDLILTQAVCEVCAVPTPGVQETVADFKIPARFLSLDAHGMEEILASIEEVGRAAGIHARAAVVVVGLRERMERIARAVAGALRPRVLALEWLDPPFAPGHWVPEMIAHAGGENLVGTAGAHSTELPWESLEGLDPDVLLIMPCGYGVEASTVDADRHAEALGRVAPRAIREARAFVLDGSSYFNRSGPRVVDGVEILAGLLHSDRAPRPRSGSWAPWTPGQSRSASPR